MRAADAWWISATLWLACALYPSDWSSREGTAAALAVALFYIVGHARGLHRLLPKPGFGSELKRVWSAWLLVTPALLGLAFATKTTDDYSRIIITSWFVLAPSVLASWRAVFGLLLNRFYTRGANTRTAAIAGVCALGQELARNIQAAPWLGLRFVGFYDDRRTSRESVADRAALRPRHKGDLKQLQLAARSGAVDLIYIALPLRAEPRINAIIRELQDTTASVYLACDFGGVDILRAEWSQIGPVQAMSVVESPFHGVDGFTKRVEDVLLALTLLGLLWLPMSLIALWIKLDGGGPVLLRHRRRGLHGEAISVLKFRTTKRLLGPGSPERVTRLGAWLRRTGLQELPQLFQVLHGEMSVVGPRPHSVRQADQWSELIYGYPLRHRVKPGMTGWAQVHSWRARSDTIDKLRRRIEYDLAYIRDWALWLDLKILLLTLRCLWRGRSAG